MRNFLSKLAGRWWKNNAMAGIALGMAMLCGQNATAQTNVTNNASVAGTLQFAAGAFLASESASTSGGRLDYPGAWLTVVRTGAFTGRILVDWMTTTNGTAKAGTDFTASSGTLAFDNGQSSAVLVVPIIDNTTTSNKVSTNVTLVADLNFSVVLTNARPDSMEDSSLIPALGSLSTAKVNIMDNDFSFNIERGDYHVSEAGGTVTVTVTLPSGMDAGTVDYTTTSGGFTPQPGSTIAQAGADYEAASGTLEFGAGQTSQTITLTIPQNNQVQFNRDFAIKLSNPKLQVSTSVTNTTYTTNGDGTVTTNNEASDLPVDMPLGRISQAIVTIYDDDSAAGAVDPNFLASMSSATEPPYNPRPGANSTVNAIAVQNNNVIVAGDFTTFNALSKGRIVRLQGDTGELDPTFDVGTGFDGSATALAVRKDGKIAVGGVFTSISGMPRYSLARLLANGGVDGSFNPGTSINGAVRDLAFTTDESKLIIAGDFTLVQGINRNGIARLLDDGSVDSTFDPGLGANGPVYAIVQQPDGKILLGGDFTAVDGQPISCVARLNSDGSLDASFVGTSVDGPVYSMDLRKTVSVSFGGVYGADVTGDVTNTVNLGAVQGNISLNYSFGATTNETELTNTLAIYYDGQLLVQRSLNATDTNDVTGVINLAFGPGKSSSFDIVVNAQSVPWHYTGTATSTSGDIGRIVIGGSFATINQESRNGLAQLNSNGTLDESYDPGTAAEDGPVYAVQVGVDGKVYAAGAFTTFNGTQRSAIARTFANGFLDTSFMDTSYNQFAGLVTLTTLDPRPFINTIQVETDGDVLIGGFFSNIGGNYSSDYFNDTSLAGTSAYNFHPDRSSKVVRCNIARLKGGATGGPGNLQLDRDNYYVDENGGAVTVSMERLNGVMGGVSLYLNTKDGTALAGDDYKAITNSMVNWADGSANKSVFSVTILNDNKAEGDQSFKLVASVPRVSSYVLGGVPIPVGVALGRRTATVNIADADVPNIFFDFSDASFYTDENSGSTAITVNRSGSSAGRVWVKYATTTNATGGVLAQPGLNYTPVSGTLTFEAGQTNKTFLVPILDNTVVEPDKVFGLSLSSPGGPGAKMGTVTNSVVTIVDNDYAPGRLSFSSTNFTKLENAGAATISVRRRGGNLGVVSADYYVEDISAIADVNYTPVTGHLEWQSGESGEKTFDIPLIDNSTVESNKTARLVLTNFVTALPGTITNAMLTIVDDDAFGKLQLSQSTAQVMENEGSLNLFVNRSGGNAGDVSVKVIAAAVTARTNVDFVPFTNVVTLVSGQISTNVTVQILDDGVAGINRTFVVKLSEPVNASLGVLTNTTVTIIDRESVNLPPGQTDPTYVNAFGANGTIYALGMQTNGNLVAAGDFTQFNKATRSRVARLLPGGDLDSSFDVGTGPSQSVRTLVIQDTGKILIGGLFTNVNGLNRNYIARLNADGSLDMQFNPGGGADNPVYAILVQNDGKIVLGGDFASYNGVNRNHIVRVNANGVIDTTFNPGAGINGTVNALALQSDGKIVVAGRFTTVNNLQQVSVARLNPDGSVDGSFSVGLGPDATVRALAIQNDGRILVGGLFTTFNGAPSGRVQRLNADGSVDETFVPGEGADNAVYAILAQPDGKILLGGDFTSFNGVLRNRIARLRMDGSVDPTINFGSGANGFVSALALQSDRKILLAGGFTQYNDEAHAYLARINGGGSADAGQMQFNLSRYSVLETGTNAVIRVVRSGGSTGEVTVDFMTSDDTAQSGVNYLGFTNTLTFAEGETYKTITVPVLHDNIATDEKVLKLALVNPTGGATLGPQPTATVTIINVDMGVGFTSTSYSVNEGVGSGQATISVARVGGTNGTTTVSFYTQDGTAFSGTHYKSTSGTISFLPGESLKTFPVGIIDEKIVEGNHTVLLYLTNPSGTTALTTASAVLTIVDNDFAAGTLRFSAGSYQVGEKGTNAVITVNRVNGFTGIVAVDFATSDGTAKAGVKYVKTSTRLAFADGETSKTVLIPIIDENAVEGDQSVILTLSNVSGGATLGSPRSVALSIVDDDFGPGSLDNGFVIGTGANAAVQSVALQPDGRIVLAGSFTNFNNTSRTYLARLNLNGALDATFNPVIDGVVKSVASLADGRVVFGGEFRNVNGASRSWVGRLATNGTSDAGFFATAGMDDSANVVLPMNGMRTVVGGNFTSPAGRAIRINDNGTLDVTFNPDGGSDGSVYAAALLADGSVVLGGSFSTMGGLTRHGIARVSANGLLDGSYANGFGADGAVYAVAALADGGVILGGNFTTINGVVCQGIARLYKNGTVDQTFAANASANGPVYALAAQTDGKIFVGGDFTSIGGGDRSRIARLNRDGLVDATFLPGTGANAPVYSIAVQLDGKVVIAGEFTTVSGAARNHIARLLGDSEFKGLMGQADVINGKTLQLYLATQPGGVYALQTSQDLTNWTSLSTNVAVETPTAFTDSNIAGINPRFYRAQWLVPYLLSVDQQTNGSLVTFSVQAGQSYLIQVSNNQTDWGTLTTNSSATTKLQYFDRGAAGQLDRFYRAVRAENP
jgi:uncharacterized delta-60 repeat protein